MTDAPAYGQQSPEDTTSDFNKHSFLIRQILGTVRTATLVQVVATTNAGDVSPVGTVDVLPLVNLLDGLGNSSPHGTVYGLPVWRLQGGKNAIICDPVVGDIGVAVFSDRDISSVKANKGQANPGSFRRFDFADGIYFGGVLGVAPTQYVQFNDAGITIADKNGNSIVMSASGIAITGNITSTGTLQNNGKSVGSTHEHSGVQTGGGNSGPPV